MERSTKEELEKWWHAQCPKCGWDGLSRDCAGGEPIADTGDFNDLLCPVCIKKDDCVVVDDYVEPDAQATIAALQARVQELEARQHFGACAKCLTNAWRICKEGTPDAVEMKCSNGSTWWLCDYCLSKEQLTQRTAECDALKLVNDTHMKTVMKLSRIVEQQTAELERVRGELAETSLYLQQERANRDSLAACVDRDVKTIKELRALILALPKVEGDFDVIARYRNENGSVHLNDEVKALLKHRQGMEG